MLTGKAVALLGVLISCAYLANLGAGDLYPEIMSMYRAGRVDQSIAPAGAVRQLLLSDSEKRLACAKHPFWERYDQHPLLAEYDETI